MFSVFKPLMLSTMHTHSHILQWLSSLIPTMEERNLHFEGYIYTKIRDGGITLNEYTTVIKHLIGL